MYGMITMALIGLLAAAAWHDVAARRIPNSLTLPGITLGLLFRTALSIKAASVIPLASGVGAIAIAFAVSFPLFAIRAVGGGDVKLLLAVGAFLGLEHIVQALLLSAVVGGAMGFVQAWRHGVLGPILRSCLNLVLYVITFGAMGMRPEAESSDSLTIPYGVAIAAGSIAGWLI